LDKKLTLQLLELQAKAECKCEKFPKELQALASLSLAAINGEIAPEEMAKIAAELEELRRNIEKLKDQRAYSGGYISSLARALRVLHLCNPDDRKICEYYPEIRDAEAPDPKKPGEMLRGPIVCGYGTSMYEFHYEYPINGMGVRKDLIKVVNPDGARTPIFDWCRENNVVVLCNRCGNDITYEVSMECPARIRFV
jgi:hypothetical protein